MPGWLQNFPNLSKIKASFRGVRDAFWSNFDGLGGSWGSCGGLGASSGVVLADSGSQVRLGRRPGRFMGDLSGLDGPNLGPKMASNWGPDRTNIDANIGRIFDAFANRNLDGQN